MQISSRKEAKKLGIKKYFPKKLCLRGHASCRSTATRTCIGCQKAWDKQRRSVFSIKQLVSRTFSNAKYLNREFELLESDIEQLLKTQNNRCALSGIQFDSEVNKPSIDRIDSSKGYLKNNVQLVLFDVNRMKTDFEQTKFLSLCQAVVNFRESRNVD